MSLVRSHPAGSKFAHSINRIVPSIVEDSGKYSWFNYFRNLSIPAYHLHFIVIKLLLRQRIYWFQGSACRKIFLRSHRITLSPRPQKFQKWSGGWGGGGYAPLASPILLWIWDWGWSEIPVWIRASSLASHGDSRSRSAKNVCLEG